MVHCSICTYLEGPSNTIWCLLAIAGLKEIPVDLLKALFVWFCGKLVEVPFLLVLCSWPVTKEMKPADFRVLLLQHSKNRIKVVLNGGWIMSL